MLNYLKFVAGWKHIPLQSSRFSLQSGLSPLFRTAGTVAVVGNGRLRAGQAAGIRACDTVVRFNMAPNAGAASGGYRTDALVLINHDWRRMARHSWQINLPVVLAAREIWLPIEPQLVDELDGVAPGRGPNIRNYSHSILERHGRFKPVRTIPAQTYRELAREVSEGGGVPSSGLLVVAYLRQYYPAARLHLFGFGHAGIDVHAWQIERAIVDRMISDGGVVRHAVAD